MIVAFDPLHSDDFYHIDAISIGHFFVFTGITMSKMLNFNLFLFLKVVRAPLTNVGRTLLFLARPSVPTNRHLLATFNFLKLGS